MVSGSRLSGSLWADARAIAAAFSHELAAGALIRTLQRAGAPRCARGCSEAEVLGAARCGCTSEHRKSLPRLPPIPGHD
jgi:hypothetical protein